MEFEGEAFTMRDDFKRSRAAPPVPDDYAANDVGIPKSHLIGLIQGYRMEPGINTALFIASGALGRKKTWTESDYGEHWIRVSGIDRRSRVSEEEKIAGILHDVLEDSDWTVADLRAVGFSDRICNAVESVTKKENEKYLDATKRASIDPMGRRVKMRDNDDNMDLTRGAFAAGDKQKYLYHISYTYLMAVEDEEITPNSSIWQFLRDERFAKLVNAENIHVIANATLEKMPDDFATRFSSRGSTPGIPYFG